MKKLLLSAAFISTTFINTESFAQANTKPVYGASYRDFVPNGWKVLATAKGDLNKDGKADIVLFLEEVDKVNFITNEELGANILNLNPRMIVIAFAENNRYRRVLQTDRFLPSENDEGARCLADPLGEMENSGLTIEKGLLKINMQFWYSCGSWSVTNATYTFRWQSNKFELIGFDNSSFHRASGEQSSTSYNFSTGKKEIISGGNQFDDKLDKPKTTWGKIKTKKRYNLANMSHADVFDEEL